MAQRWRDWAERWPPTGPARRRGDRAGPQRSLPQV